MFNKIFSFFNRSSNFDKEVESFKKNLDKSLELKAQEFDNIRLENAINNEDDLKQEIEKIKLVAYKYEMRSTKLISENFRLVFHFLNIGQIKEFPSQVKLIQIYFNENIFFEDLNDFFSNSKSRFAENCKIIAITELQFREIYGKEEFDNFLLLNEGIKLTPIASIPNYSILGEYNDSINASAISLNHLQYGDAGSQIYDMIMKQMVDNNEFSNQICGYPYWNGSLYLESQHFLKLNELVFLAQYKFDKKFIFEEYESEMNIYFFYDKKTQEIKYIFNSCVNNRNYG